MSKYKAPWKEYDLNKDFWREVLIGCKVEYFGPGEKKVKIGGDQATFLKEMHLDSGECVWLAEDVVWTGPGESLAGKTITDLEWVNDVGIDFIEFHDGAKIVLPLKGWRICIQD
jgi:hypothetical protein